MPADIQAIGKVAIPSNAWSVGAFLACEHGRAVQYRATLERHGPASVRALVAKLLCSGLIRDQAASNGADRYASFQILDETAWSLETYDITSQADFEHLRKTLAMRGDFECDICARHSPHRCTPKDFDGLLRGLAKRLHA